MITRAEREKWSIFIAGRIGGETMTAWLIALDAADALREVLDECLQDTRMAHLAGPLRDRARQEVARYDAAVEPKA